MIDIDDGFAKKLKIKKDDEDYLNNVHEIKVCVCVFMVSFLELYFICR